MDRRSNKAHREPLALHYAVGRGARTSALLAIAGNRGFVVFEASTRRLRGAGLVVRIPTVVPVFSPSFFSTGVIHVNILVSNTVFCSSLMSTSFYLESNNYIGPQKRNAL